MPSAPVPSPVWVQSVCVCWMSSALVGFQKWRFNSISHNGSCESQQLGPCVNVLLVMVLHRHLQKE